MAETIKFTLENTAVFAERSRDIRFVSRVNETANELNMALNPAIQESGREIDENILKIVGGLAEEGEWPCDSVRTLIETVNDPHRTANKEVAEGRLEILAYSTYMAMTYGKNDLLNQAVGTKDGAVIDAALPESMKGVGALVAEIAINREITNPKLKEELRKLDRKVEFLNVSGVSRVRLREIIEDKIVELSSLVDELDERGYDELMRLSAFFGAEIQKLSIDNEVSNIPESVEGQLAICRALLAKIESSNKTTRDLTLGQYAARLEEMAQEEGIFPEVATEIMARLKLHDSAVLMRKANGYIESPESGADPECPNVGMASTLAEGLGHALDSESIYFFLKTNSNGIPVAEAWDMYQKINCGYRSYLDSIDSNLSSNLKTVVDGDPDMGTIDATFFTDSNPARKKQVEDRAVLEIVRLTGVDEKTARKAWSLAKKLALATGENSVFNAAMTGNDQMAEDIYLKQYRKGRDKNGRPRGPQITIAKISGVGNSWLRRVSNRQPYTPDGGLVPLLSRDVIVEPGEIGDNRVGIEDGSYVYHFGVWWSGKIHPLRRLLLERQPDPKKYVGLDMLQNAVDYFAKADPDGSKGLRKWWIYGVLDMACSNGDLGWTQDDISRFRNFLTSKNLSDIAGPFISRDLWDEIMRKGGFANKMLRLDLKRTVQDFSSGVSGSGGRR